MPATLSRPALFAVVILVAVPWLQAQQSPSTELKYQVPPEVMVKLVDAPPTPTISLSPAQGEGPRRILIQQSSSLPTIADLAEPELRLAGLRFNPYPLPELAPSLPRSPSLACRQSSTSFRRSGLPMASTSPWSMRTPVPKPARVLQNPWGSASGSSMSPGRAPRWCLEYASTRCLPTQFRG